MAQKKQKSSTDKFHFANGLLKELRSKAAPKRSDLFSGEPKKASARSAKARATSAFAKLPNSVARRIIEE